MPSKELKELIRDEITTFVDCERIISMFPSLEEWNNADDEDKAEMVDYFNQGFDYYNGKDFDQELKELNAWNPKNRFLKKMKKRMVSHREAQKKNKKNIKKYTVEEFAKEIEKEYKRIVALNKKADKALAELNVE